MIRTVLLSATQALGLLAAAMGLYLLAGLAWTLIVVGLGLAALATLAELAPSRSGGGS